MPRHVASVGTFGLDRGARDGEVGRVAHQVGRAEHRVGRCAVVGRVDIAAAGDDQRVDHVEQAVGIVGIDDRKQHRQRAGLADRLHVGRADHVVQRAVAVVRRRPSRGAR